MSHPILDLILSRRSIRKFTDEPVPHEILVDLLKAGMAAPSATNSRPWEFIVITDAEQLDSLRKVLPLGKYNAPVAIIPCHNPLIASNPANLLFWQQDCSAAVENILIAATAMGLGSVWIGVYPLHLLVRAVRRVIKAPVWITPLCVIQTGFPAQQKPPRTQYEEQRVHCDRY